MSKDIRSFFNVVSKKSGGSVPKASPSKPKNRIVVISDDEDVIKETPEKSKTSNKKRIQVISSDSEDEKKKSPKKLKTKVESKLKPVNIDDIFSNKTVKQSKVDPIPETKPVNNQIETNSKKKSKKKKGKTELGVHDDENFEKTLLDLDDDLLLENADFLDRTIEEALQKNNGTVKDKKDQQYSDKNDSQESVSEDNNESNKKEKKKRQRKHSEESTPKKAKLEHTDSGIDPDQEAFEKKRYSAMLYQKYKNRGGPKHHGEKELPKGTPNCLSNLTFLRTGVLDSLEGEEFENLVKEHGGRVVHGVSKKVNYLVVGEDAGPAKLDKARGLNIPEISEDVLLDMILTRSGMKAKYCNIMSFDSQESGIEVEDIVILEDLKDDIQIDKENESNKKRTTDKEKEVTTAFRRDFKHKDETQKDKEHREKPKSKERDQKEKMVNKEKEKIKEKERDHKEKHKEKVDKEQKSEEKRKTENESKSSKEKVNDKEKHKEKVNKEQKSEEKRKTEDESKSNKPNLKKFFSETIPSPVKVKKVEKVAEDTPKIDKKDVAESPTTPAKPTEYTRSWTEKYKPKDVKSIIGQQDPSSNLNKLRKWLMNWYRNQLPEVRKKIPRPSPWAKNDDGAFYKAALLSGPPGVGKTTTATLLTKELGFDIVEFNASDTRSKKLLHEEVAQLLGTTTIAGYATGQQKTTNKKRVLLMDEVDGMAGNEDRGGIQELINLLKNTSVPIICMCNDRNHQKMRSLVNYCFDLRFNKPKLEQIRGAMMSICFKEGIKILPNALTEIINGTGCDVRQTLNHLSMWSATEKNISLEMATKESKSAKKDTVLGPWEVIRSVFTESEQKNMTIADKSRLFFFDYSLGPLFVQENYLQVAPNCPKKDVLKRVALAADSISKGDLIDSKIRSSNNWSLLEVQAMYASVLPGHYMSGHITGRINFPGWLGKNSSHTKHKRMLSELHIHTRTSTSGSKLAMSLDYLKPLRDSIITPLKKYGSEGVHRAIEVMKAYNLLREDLTNLLELCQWKDTKNPFNDIEPKVKTAFTKAYNKEGPLLPFAPGAGVSKKKASTVDESLLGEDQDVSDEEDGDDVNADAMIKVKSKESKKKNDTTKAASSKGKNTTKGGGKGKNKKS